MSNLHFRFHQVNKLFIFLSLCLLLVAIPAVASDKNAYDEYFYAVFDAQMIATGVAMGTLPQRSFDITKSTLHQLFKMKKSSNNLDRQLVALLDYYIGAGSSEMLDEFITERGNSILPLLEEKKTKPIECIPKYKKICMEKNYVKFRNYDIDRCIDAIKEGKVLRADEVFFLLPSIHGIKQ